MARHAILPFEFIRVQLVFADRLAELYKSDQADALTRETILPSLNTATAQRSLVLPSGEHANVLNHPRPLRRIQTASVRQR